MYNDASSESSITIHSQGLPDVAIALRPTELRVRTGWQQHSSRVTFEWENGAGLRFDNLAYLPEP